MLSSFLTDNIDDPTGNFRGTPLTGWKVFLLLLCALLGIVVCAVVGAVVFQKRQERNKRFYWGVRRERERERRTLSERCLLWNELFPDDRFSTSNVNFFSKDCTNVYILEALRLDWITVTRDIGKKVQTHRQLLWVTWSMLFVFSMSLGDAGLE